MMALSENNTTQCYRIKCLLVVEKISFQLYIPNFLHKNRKLYKYRFLKENLKIGYKKKIKKDGHVS